MDKLDLSNKSDREKFRKLQKNFLKFAIGVMLCGFAGIIFCKFMYFILPSSIGEFFDYFIVGYVIPLMILIETILFLSYAAFALFKTTQTSIVPEQSFFNRKIIVTNNPAEIKVNKSDKLKYTEEDVMNIINNVLKNPNTHIDKNNIMPSTCCSMAINAKVNSSNSYSFGESNIFERKDSLFDRYNNPSNPCYKSTRREDTFSDRYNNPANPYYPMYHSTGNDNSITRREDSFADRYTNPANPYYNIYH